MPVVQIYPSMTEQYTDYDNPWKQVIEDFFPDFLEFFFPQAYAVIDWTRGYEFLDKELQQLEADAEIGRRLVDKVAKVWLLDGEEAWVLIHVEVQGYYEKKFPQRIYEYNYRLFDKYNKQVISLAILADESESWRPSSYGYSLGGCRLSLEFPVVKILDYQTQWQMLEESSNPFAMVVMAHLQTKATHSNPQNRLDWKLRLVRMLFCKGYEREKIINLFRFIDWIMLLPFELTRNFKAELKREEEENKMRYVTSIERLAKEEGKIEGKMEGKIEGKIENAQENIVKILQIRFGSGTEQVVEVINHIDDLTVLETLLTSAITIGSLKQFQQLLD